MQQYADDVDAHLWELYTYLDAHQGGQGLPEVGAAIVELHLPYVRSYARQTGTTFGFTGDTLTGYEHDLVAFALEKVVPTFDPTRGRLFVGWFKDKARAVRWHSVGDDGPVRLGKNSKRLRTAAKSYVATHQQEYGVEPTHQQVADELTRRNIIGKPVTLARIPALLSPTQAVEPVSVDDDGERSFLDTLPDQGPSVEEQVATNLLTGEIGTVLRELDLTPLEESVLTHRLLAAPRNPSHPGQGGTIVEPRELARRLGVTRSELLQAEASLRQRLQDALRHLA